MMKFSRRTFLTGISLVAVVVAQGARPSSAWTHGALPAFNGKLIQTNVTSEGAYPFLNAFRSGSIWAFNVASTVPLLPTDLDGDGYFNNNAAGSGSGGVSTLFRIPSQSERPGLWIFDWTGNGVCGTGSMSATAYSIQITGVSQLGGVQTYQLAASPRLLIAGMPIAISGLSGGTWAGANATVQVLAVDTLLNTISINTGVTFTGSPTISGSAKAQCVTTTTVANGTGFSDIGRYVLQPGPNGGGGGQSATVSITSVRSTTDYPRNIRFFHQDDEATLALGRIFTTTYLALYSNVGAIRDFEYRYGTGNRCNVSTWSTRKSMSYFSLLATELRRNLFPTSNNGQTIQSVSAAGCTYAIGAPSSFTGLSDKATVQFWLDRSTFASIASLVSDGGGNTIVTFNTSSPNTSFAEGETVIVASVSNGAGSGWTACNGTFPIVAGSVTANSLKIAVDTSSATGSASLASATVRHSAVLLQVGAGAAVPMRDFTSSLLNITLTAGTQNAFCTSVYDLSLNAWITEGAQGVGIGHLRNYAPPELIFELCRVVGAHPHLVAPQFALDDPTDWVPEQMKMATQYQIASPWMVPSFEGPNELWNPTFPQTNYAVAKANQRGWGSFNFDDWYGMIMSLMGQMGTAVFGVRPGAATTYAILCAVQTTLNTSPTGVSAARTESTLFFNAGVAPPSITIAGIGTINFTAARAAGTTAQGGTTATNYISHMCPAQYWNTSIEGVTSGSPTTETALTSAFGGCQFVATSNGDGTLTVASVTFGSIIFDGSMSLLGTGVPSGVTIASQASGTPGGAGIYNLSSGAFNVGYSQTFHGGLDLTAADTFVSFAEDAVFNGTVSGTSLTVNSLTSGVLGSGTLASIRIYGGTIAYGDNNAKIVGGTYPNFTLQGSPGNQSNVSFKAGRIATVAGCKNLYFNCAQYGLNHNIKKMRGYEGGYSPDYTNLTAQSAVDQLKRQTKFSAQLQALTTLNWDNFLGRTANSLPVGVTSEFPSQYLLTGLYPTGGVWQVLEDIYLMPRPPIWQAISAYV